MEIQAPDFLPRCIRLASVSDSFPAILSNARMVMRLLRIQISPLPSFNSIAWFPDKNSIPPCREATKWVVKTQDDVQFSGAYRVGSGSTVPAWFMRSRLTRHPGVCFSTPWNNTGRNYLRRASSNNWNFPPTPWVMRFTKYHSYCSEFFMPVQACLQIPSCHPCQHLHHPFPTPHLCSSWFINTINPLVTDTCSRYVPLLVQIFWL